MPFKKVPTNGRLENLLWNPDIFQSSMPLFVHYEFNDKNGGSVYVPHRLHPKDAVFISAIQAEQEQILKTQNTAVKNIK